MHRRGRQLEPFAAARRLADGHVLLAGRDLQRCEAYLRRIGHAVESVGTLAHARRRLATTKTSFEAALVGINLPDGNGLDLVSPLLDRQPLCRSIVVSESAEPELPARALRAGAQSFLPWPCGPGELRQAVEETVAASRRWRERLGQGEHSGGLPAESVDGGGMSPVALRLPEIVARLRFLADLTPMQTIVVWRILWGDGNERIAALLGVTRRTVKYHVNQVLQRTGARSRGDILRVVLEDAGVQDPWEGLDEVPR